MASIILLAAYLLAAAILYAAYVIYHQYTYWKRRRMLHLELVPLLGNNATLQLRADSFAGHYYKLYQRCPGARYFGMFDFKRPAVLIKDPEIIRDVCIKSFDSFVDHDAFVTEEMDPIVGRNLFSLKGQRWKSVRNTLTPSFTTTRMKAMFQLIEECSNDFVQYFLENPEVISELIFNDMIY